MPSSLVAIRSLLFGVLATGSLAVGSAQDKTAYNLLNPTPRAFLRGMNPDRPGRTESPYTVDAGRVQVELGFVEAVFDRDRTSGDLSSAEWFVAPVNVKVGLLNNMDIQLVVNPHSRQRFEDRAANTVSTGSGVGEMQTRLKLNFWGNDDGKASLAVMPFVKWPLTSSDVRNGHTEGGFMLPLQVNLNDEWVLGAMTELDFVVNDSGSHYTELVNTITVGPQLTDRLGVFVEFVAVTSSADSLPWQGLVDVGSTYLLSENLQLDYGCNFGITDAAPDFNPFAGVSWRF